jgi:hypothetical protein
MSSTYVDDDEQIPRTSPPATHKGFLFAGAFFVAEVISVMNDEPLTEGLVLAWLGGWGYWLYCVHRMHKVLAELTDYRYPIPPGKAAGRHAFPWYNIFWILYWPHCLSVYLNSRGRVRMIPGVLLGLMLLLSLLLVLVDGAVGLAFIFAVTLYLSGKLAEHVKPLGVVTPSLPATLPEPNVLSQPEESFTSPARESAEETRVGDRYRIFGGLR